MGNHRAPAPTRPPHVWLALMGAACAGILLPPVVIAAQAVAPRPVAERLSLTPERAAEPMGHGGLGGALTVPTVGVVGPTDLLTERNAAWPAATVGATGPVSRKPTAPSATSTSAPSEGSTAIEPQGTVSTPQGLPREAAGASSESPTGPTVAPGSSTPNESTPSTRNDWRRETTQPDPICSPWRCRTGTPAATQTTTTEATTTTEETTISEETQTP